MVLFVPPRSGLVVTADWREALDHQETYEPRLVAVTTAPNLGTTGLTEGGWGREGRWVAGWARAQFGGTGIAAGSGMFLFSLPVEPDLEWLEVSSTGGAGTMVGWGRVRNNSAGAESRMVNTMLRRATGNHPGTWLWMQATATNTSIGSGTFAWATGDSISVDFEYPGVI